MEGQKPAVLLVDDEENILKMLRRTLRREEYTLHTADSAEKGLEILAANKIGVVFSDCKMPGMGGEKFLEIVREKYPRTYRIMHSGATYTDPEELVSSGLVERFLEKPADIQIVKYMINEGIEIYKSRKK